jgi:hypothetical protein
MSGGRGVHTQLIICVAQEGEKSTKTVREFTGDEILQTTTIDGIENLVCFEKFKRIAC